MATKKKTIEIKEDIQDIDSTDILIAKLNKELKSGEIRRACDIDGSFILRRPTGLISLDIELAGGFPRGISVLKGPENSGKTALAYEIFKNIQATYGAETRIALLMTETFDKLFAKQLGFQIAFNDKEIEQLEKAYNRPLTEKERDYMKMEIGKIYHIHYPTAEALLQATLGLLASNKFHALLIDSVANMETEEEHAKDMDEKSRGGLGKVFSQFFRKLAGIGHFDTTAIMINQLRDTMATNSYEKKTGSPGGRSLRHNNFITLELTPGSRIVEEVSETKKIQYGRVTNWFMEKGKAGCHDGGRGEYIFYNGALGHPFGFDKAQDLLNTAVYYNLIQKSGAWFSYNGENIAQGGEKCAEVIRNWPPEMVEKIRSEIFEKANIKFITKEP